MKKYIIYSNEGDQGEFIVVSALNSEHAKELYCSLIETKRKDYLEYVYSGQIEDTFERDDKGSFFFYHPYEGYSERENGFILRDDLEPEDAMIIIASNIKKVFKDYPDYYDLYLKFYHGGGEVEIEEAQLHVVSESFGLIAEPSDQRRRWNDYIKRCHEHWQFPEEMLVILAVASWGRDMVIKPLSEFEIN